AGGRPDGVATPADPQLRGPGRGSRDRPSGREHTGDGRGAGHGGVDNCIMASAALPTLAPAPAVIPTRPARARVDGVDAVRGLVMVLMALDHVRDFMQSQPYRATDLTWTTPALFASRLVTHLCAPVFILLAGTGIYLAQRRKARGEMVRFLVTRGLWLVLLELTVIKFFWYQTLDYTSIEALVIWTIG